MRKAFALSMAAAAALTLAMVGTVGDADARDGTPSYQWTYDTKDRNARGFQGYAGPGPYAPYCSYWRVPKRKCTTSKSGRRSCRTVGWRVTQNCG